MAIFDAHCDVLLKLFEDPSIEFKDSEKLQANLTGMRNSHIKLQVFAIFVPPELRADQSFTAACEMAKIFHEKIVGETNGIVHVKSKADLASLNKNQIGAMLALEGCDPVGKDINKLKEILGMGVSSVGLTWNWANAVADGAMEARGRGLTPFGREVVEVLNETNTWCDVSHLSERGFWDVMEIAEFPMASHSNSFTKCPHPRNLKDDQIRAIIRRDTVMGITFVPHFLTKAGKATISDVIRHLDHVCSLGGEDHVGFGSDFDGIEKTVEGLSSASEYDNLINELQKYYSEIQVTKFLYENMKKRLPQ
ncbi:diguanylate cyclase [Bacillus sp. FJAT-27225]|uniref:dipeptidase n=1 Tax=Bacillus sp. FJAT-27225 TaxID=1743144 RepID=UPI00080C2C08|nr:dipeptidase [Bacillus sp. FJAT-27225]OCA85400.1 diguanylate cyclase [Bacillus sp. FJAT-27225]